MLTDRQMNQLRAQYSGLKRIRPEQFDRLKATVGKFPDSILEQIADSDIEFLNTAANSVLCDRKIRPETARLDHAIALICRKQGQKLAI